MNINDNSSSQNNTCDFELVKDSVVAITTEDGGVIGTGFFVSAQGHLLTCAHVVDTTRGRPYIEGQKAEIVYLGDQDADDFAVLKTPLPKGMSFVPCLNFNPKNFKKGEKFLSIGFGRKVFTYGGTIEGSITDDNECEEFSGLRMLRLSTPTDAQRIEEGYSGSPLFNKETNRIVGLIASYDRNQGGLAVPLSTVLGKYPELAKEVYPLIDPIGPVLLDSPFYIERPDREESRYSVEDVCYGRILSGGAGALLRLKAPSQMGKTSLINRIRDYTMQRGYQFVGIELEGIGQGVIADSYELSRRLCTMVSTKLGLRKELFPDKDSGTDFYPCYMYFQECVLKEAQKPIVLALDNFDRLFSYPQVAKDFCDQLRTWYQEGTDPNNPWHLLRLVIAYSTDDIYTPEIHGSPLRGVGRGVELPELTPEQVQTLTQRYGLTWGRTKNVNKLMQLVGGHPWLIRQALYYIARNGAKLERLLDTATKHGGIYADHLYNIWGRLYQKPELYAAYQEVIKSSQPVTLNRQYHYQLYRMGLVKGSFDQVVPRCDLYRHYFSK